MLHNELNNVERESVVKHSDRLSNQHENTLNSSLWQEMGSFKKEQGRHSAGNRSGVASDHLDFSADDIFKSKDKYSGGNERHGNQRNPEAGNEVEQTTDGRFKQPRPSDHQYQPHDNVQTLPDGTVFHDRYNQDGSRMRESISPSGYFRRATIRPDGTREEVEMLPPRPPRADDGSDMTYRRTTYNPDGSINRDTMFENGNREIERWERDGRRVVMSYDGDGRLVCPPHTNPPGEIERPNANEYPQIWPPEPAPEPSAATTQAPARHHHRHHRHN